jgi:hypothetical protein
MKVLITDGEKHLGGKVRGRGLSKKVLISLVGGG